MKNSGGDKLLGQRHNMISRFALGIGIAFSIAQVQALEFFQDPATTGVLTVRDGVNNILSYNYGDQLPKGVAPDFIRSTYIHPLWGLDGKVLTDDFTVDHRHHHGIFWGWPIVKTRGLKTENWMPGNPPLRQHFVRWIEKTTDTESATLVFENRWLLNKKEEVARERVRIMVHPVRNDSRAIDVAINLEAVGGPLTLQGSQEEKKGYGGFSYRAAPEFKGARLSTDSGIKSKDIMMERAKWMDLSNGKNGLAIFVAPDHPDYPPYGFGRNSYTGFLNPSWPGLKPTELAPGKPVTLRYRLYIHKGEAPPESIQKAYDSYVKQLKLPSSNG